MKILTRTLETLSGKSKLILNEVGIQMPPSQITKKLFPSTTMRREQAASESSLRNIRKHLEKFGINCCQVTELEKEVSTPSGIPNLRIPDLEGRNLLEHFWSIAIEQIEPDTRNLGNFLTELEDKLVMPAVWPDASTFGWHICPRFNCTSVNCSWKLIDYPPEDVIVLDVEVITAFNLPVLAVALSSNHWYVWISRQMINPDLSRYNPNNGFRLTADDLIGIGNREKCKASRIIIGHNVSFDRSYLRSQYDWNNGPGNTRFLDTLSLHMACSGLGSSQRQTYQYLNQEYIKKRSSSSTIKATSLDDHELTNPAQLWAHSTAKIRHAQCPQLRWLNESAANNLADVFSLYCPEEAPLSKEIRSVFTSFKTTDSITDVMTSLRSMFSDLCTYCANDVKATFKVSQRLFPLFLDRFPNPVTLAGMLEMSTMILPVNEKAWTKYISRSIAMVENRNFNVLRELKRKVKYVDS